jgi:hypothetical protein
MTLDVEQQIYFVYNNTIKKFCNSLANVLKPVLGMDEVLLKIYSFAVHEGHQNKTLAAETEKSGRHILSRN